MRRNNTSLMLGSSSFAAALALLWAAQGMLAQACGFLHHCTFANNVSACVTMVVKRACSYRLRTCHKIDREGFCHIVP